MGYHFTYFGGLGKGLADEDVEVSDSGIGHCAVNRACLAPVGINRSACASTRGTYQPFLHASKYCLSTGERLPGLENVSGLHFCTIVNIYTHIHTFIVYTACVAASNFGRSRAQGTLGRGGRHKTVLQPAEF